MDVVTLDIPEVLLLMPAKHRDERGVFFESFNQIAFDEIGIGDHFVQDNHVSTTMAGTVRGLHFQALPHAQGKVVRVVRGKIFDVALDIRQGSPTFGCFVSLIMSAADGYQLWVPEGFAHGYCTLEHDTEVLYKVTKYYAPESEAGVAWDDPALGIGWPVDIDSAVLAERDRNYPTLSQLPRYFEY